MQSKEIELRDEQVRFLKETILALEQEKDSLLAQHAHSRAKLKQMAAEIANYNTTVVQKIYEENQELLRQLAALQEQLEAALSQRDEAAGRLRESEGRVQSHSSEKQELSTANESLKEARSRQDKRVAVLEKENRELQGKNIALQRQLDESSSQISYCSQQIDVLTQKHHEALKLAEKRLRQATEKMVAREDFERAERDARDASARNKQLRGDLERAGRENERLRLEMSALRDRLVSAEVREETRSQQLRIDLANLSQSVKIGKRVAEFESEDHASASAVYQAFRDLWDRSSAQEQQLKEYAERLKEAAIEQHALQEENRFLGLSAERAREARAEEGEAREAEYEQRLMELGLRLKREEVALAGLRAKEDELEALREEREREGDQHRQQTAAMGRTIEELRKENFRLGSELGEAIRLCEENLVGRECVSYYKYVVLDLVALAHYLHLHLARARERTLKLYRPFLSYYLAIHPALAAPPPSPLRRLRAAVQAVVAVGRMRRERGRAAGGLEWYGWAAGERREKLEKAGQLVEALSGAILGGAKAAELLRIGEGSYRWRVPNYLKVRLPIGDDRKILREGELESPLLD